MRIAVCDDNVAFSEHLIDEIRHWSAINNLENSYIVLHSAKELLVTDLSEVQVLFLDIEMPGCNGLEAAKKLRAKYPDIILVFVTNWLQYAPAGYKVNAFRYVLKRHLSEELRLCMDAIRQKITESHECAILQQRDSSFEVEIKNILYFEGTAYRSVLVHTISKPEVPIECVGKLSDYEKRFNDYGFLRIQKSFLVNMAHLDRIRNRMAFFRNGIELKVSEKNYAEISRRYLLWRGQKI